MPTTERRRRTLTVLALAAALTPFAVGAATYARAAPAADVAFTFTDPAIVESSGLAVVGDHVVTTNDSGDTARVFTIDPASGDTVGVTTWGSEAVDVEALAPAGPGHVWVADVGDNRRTREEVLVARVPVGPGVRQVEAPTYRLRLPEGAADVETLLAHPATGRLLLVTKSVFAGRMLLAPDTLAPDTLAADEVNELSEVGSVAGIVTDGTFLPDGRHIVLRTYTDALLYSYPDFELIERWELPAQSQGEGIAVDGARLLLSTEGAHSDVLAVPVPPVAAARTAAAETITLLRRALYPHLP